MIWHVPDFTPNFEVFIKSCFHLVHGFKFLRIDLQKGVVWLNASPFDFKWLNWGNVKRMSMLLDKFSAIIVLSKHVRESKVDLGNRCTVKGEKERNSLFLVILNKLNILLLKFDWIFLRILDELFTFAFEAILQVKIILIELWLNALINVSILTGNLICISTKQIVNLRFHFATGLCVRGCLLSVNLHHRPKQKTLV